MSKPQPKYLTVSQAARLAEKDARMNDLRPQVEVWRLQKERAFR